MSSTAAGDKMMGEWRIQEPVQRVDWKTGVLLRRFLQFRAGGTNLVCKVKHAIRTRIFEIALPKDALE